MDRALLGAASSGNLAEVNRLLAAGANPNVTFLNHAHLGTAAIIEAALNNHTDVIRRLVEGGADPNIRGYYNHTALTNILGALHYMSANKSTIQTLIDVGINLDAQTRDGSTALMIAIEHQNNDIVTLLLDAGANPTIQDSHGNSALLDVLTYDKDNLVKRLLEEGANPNLANRSGTTAIMMAGLTNKDVVQALLDAGADVNVIDAWGKSPLIHVAEFSKNLDILRLILNHTNEQNLKIAAQLASENRFKPEINKLILSGIYGERRVFRKLIGAIPVNLKKGAKPNYGRFSEVNPETWNTIIGPFIGIENIKLENIPRDFVRENNENNNGGNNNLPEHNLGAIQINMNNNDENNTNNAKRNNDHNNLIKLFGPFKPTQNQKRNNNHNNLIKLFGPFKPNSQGGRHRKTKKRSSRRRAAKSHKRRA
jgi:hypothetical protein